MTVGLGTGSTSSLLPRGARGPRPRRSLRRDVAGDRGAAAAPRSSRRALRRSGGAGPARPRGRRRRPGRTRRLGREGRRRRPHAGEDRRRRGRALRRDRLVGQARRARDPAGTARAAPASGSAATLQRLGDARLRDAPPTPDGGALADWLGEVGDPRELAARFAATPGVVEHGLFPPDARRPRSSSAAGTGRASPV